MGVWAAEMSAAQGTGVCEVAGAGPATRMARGWPADWPTTTEAKMAGYTRERT